MIFKRPDLFPSTARKACLAYIAFVQPDGWMCYTPIGVECKNCTQDLAGNPSTADKVTLLDKVRCDEDARMRKDIEAKDICLIRILVKIFTRLHSYAMEAPRLSM